MKSIRFEQGVGMIEVLITLFILSVGLLGVASLQLVGSFTNAEALSRTQAEFVAEQAVERLRAAAIIDTINDGELIHDEYFDPSNYNFNGLSCSSSDRFTCHCDSRPESIPDCEGAICSQAQMARFDAWALSCSAIQANPLTEIAISCADNGTVVDALACSPGSFIQVQLRWPLRVASGTGGGEEVQTDDRCPTEDGQRFSCVTKVIAL
jgi:type IV pilus assembly protein PilV